MNNRLGHSAGDKMLISIGKEICTQFRNDSNDAYRIGGDEFIIFCRNIPEQIIQEKTILKNISKIFITLFLSATHLQKMD